MDIRAVLFDMFGTCVDWRGSLMRECARVGSEHGIELDWEHLVDAWRRGYAPAIDRIRSGELPWMNLDALNELILQGLIADAGHTLPTDVVRKLNRCWERLSPWSDVREGLIALKRNRVIAPLSNGTVATLVGIAKYGDLPWDCVLSSELGRCYKWDREAYLLGVSLLRLEPQMVLMVAAHRGDLKAARKAGMRTCFVSRPHEYGPRHNPDLTGEDEFDFHVDNFLEIAGRLDTATTSGTR